MVKLINYSGIIEEENNILDIKSTYTTIDVLCLEDLLFGNCNFKNIFKEHKKLIYEDKNKENINNFEKEWCKLIAYILLTAGAAQFVGLKEWIYHKACAGADKETHENKSFLQPEVLLATFLGLSYDCKEIENKRKELLERAKAESILPENISNIATYSDYLNIRNKLTYIFEPGNIDIKVLLEN